MREGQNFAAIDFETANYHRSSVCSVGIVVVRNGVVTNRFYSLIRPEPNYYSPVCQQVHGLGPEDTDCAEVFPKVWEKAEPLIKGLPLVAHNAVFDAGCLRAVMNVYGMDWPEYKFYCTLRASRRRLRYLRNHQLHTVATACGYHLEHHHHALADAEACAAIALTLDMCYSPS
ncbi:MAG: 3'-5' exonuclease [Bacteroidales bacterium]|nr:3'-5' exonuclease [Bacteroidales bacterium]